MRKDCINEFIGVIRPDGSNALVDWVNKNRLQALLVVGICTDICVMGFVLTAFSARNHDIMPGLENIIVHAPACATHYIGLNFMASGGAVLADAVRFAL